MDWQGQKLSEQIMQYLLLGSALVAFVTGYVTSSYRMMLIMYLIGVAITFLFTVPDWSFFNRSPLEWTTPVMEPSTRQLRMVRQQQQQLAAAARRTATATIKPEDD